MATAKLDLLQSISFGQRVAEEEAKELASYFVETDQWRRLVSDDVDIVYGPKGAGKSALYALLLQRADMLLDRQIIIVPAENPRGATVFKDLQADPPVSEREFISLWKLYFISLVGKQLKLDFFANPKAKRVIEALEDAKLITQEISLRGLLQGVAAYIKMLFRPESVEAGMKVDPSTGLPTGFTGKISLREPKPGEAIAGTISVDTLFGLANECLSESGYSIWLAIDRLDVAFIDSAELEESALRALFRAYLDLRYDNIRIKIFLRSDIWQRISAGGFREASHVTRSLTLQWDRKSLLHLVTSRALKNESLRKHYGIGDASSVLGSQEEQENLFRHMCPDQVDQGPNKPKTFDWMISRTVDGTKKYAPRELIHFMSSLRDVQIHKLEIGDPEPADELLFTRAAFKDALPEVSKVRLEQTLYSEHPKLKSYIEALRRGKASHTIESLSQIWKISADEANQIVGQLVEVGFFERREKKEGVELWVPFLYRDGLELVQGSSA